MYFFHISSFAITITVTTNDYVDPYSDRKSSQEEILFLLYVFDETTQDLPHTKGSIS